MYTEVPDDQVLCGFSISTSNDQYITKLDFNMATIKDYVKIDHSKDVPKYIVKHLKFVPGADNIYKQKWP